MYDQVILYLTDPDSQQLILKALASANHDQIIRSDSIENEMNLAQLAAQQNRPIRIHDLKLESPEYHQGRTGRYSIRVTPAAKGEQWGGRYIELT